MSASEPAEDLGRRLEVQLQEGRPLSEDTRRRLFAALVRRYAEGWRRDGPGPYAAGQASTEEVLVTAAGMLREAEVTSFELAALFDV